VSQEWVRPLCGQGWLMQCPSRCRAAKSWLWTAYAKHPSRTTSISILDDIPPFSGCAATLAAQEWLLIEKSIGALDVAGQEWHAASRESERLSCGQGLLAQWPPRCRPVQLWLSTAFVRRPSQITSLTDSQPLYPALTGTAAFWLSG